MSTYKGYTYPRIFQNRFIWLIWKKFFCTMGWHLWDEVESIDSHSIYCDACGIEEDIK